MSRPFPRFTIRIRATRSRLSCQGCVRLARRFLGRFTPKNYTMSNKHRKYFCRGGDRVEAWNDREPLRCRRNRAYNDPPPCFVRHWGSTQTVDSRSSCTQDLDMLLDVRTFNKQSLVQSILGIRTAHLRVLAPLRDNGVPCVLSSAIGDDPKTRNIGTIEGNMLPGVLISENPLIESRGGRIHRRSSNRLSRSFLCIWGRGRFRRWGLRDRPVNVAL